MPTIQVTSLSQHYHNRVVVLQNLLKRITPSRGREEIYTLKGTITLEERNAIVVALNELKIKSHSLRLPGGRKEVE